MTGLNGQPRTPEAVSQCDAWRTINEQRGLRRWVTEEDAQLKRFSLEVIAERTGRTPQAVRHRSGVSGAITRFATLQPSIGDLTVSPLPLRLSTTDAMNGLGQCRLSRRQ